MASRRAQQIQLQRQAADAARRYQLTRRRAAIFTRPVQPLASGAPPSPPADSQYFGDSYFGSSYFGNSYFG